MDRFRCTPVISLVVLISVTVPPLAAQKSASSEIQHQAAKSDFTIEKLDTVVRFAADGTGERERTMRIKLESDAAVRALGVLVFAFQSENEELAVKYVRVRKADGTVVETPRSSIQETASPVASAAPMYSDSRVMQIPVRALAQGDWLEYQITWVRKKPIVPNQFWYEHDFVVETDVKEETLTVRVPSGKYVRLNSPRAQPELREEGADKVYFWKTSHAAETEKAERPTLKKDAKEAQDESQPRRHSVELTTFRTWDEVGQWYAGLSAGKVAVTPLIQAKAEELTRGLTSAEARERALYDFVSTKFRYISISFGEGRYQPHSADEVLSNLYGDCKDKHTLLASLLRAVGIEASAALIGAEMPFDPDIPSPAQFNHVITVIPGNGAQVWLDTTPEVAPFGMILKPLRDHQALVVPPAGPSRLVTTPAAAPEPYLESIRFKGGLDAEGTLTGHADFTMHGDADLLMRSIFHQVQPAEWQTFAQRFSETMGYTGTVSAVDVDNPQDTSKPFHYGWDLTDKKYSDWANLRILAPLPTTGLPALSDNSAEPIDLGNEGVTQYEATLQLPAGYSVEIPGPVHEIASFAEFESAYSVSNSVLEAHHKTTFRQEKIPASARAEYQKFSNAVNASLGRYILLVRADGNSAVTENSPRAEELLEEGVRATQNGDFNSARDALSQAELINPKQRSLWAAYAYLYGLTGQQQKALDSIRKELQLHPDQPQTYRMLAEMENHASHNAEAAAALRGLLKIAPNDLDGMKGLAALLTSSKEYDEAISVLEKARALSPDDLHLEAIRIMNLLRAGKKGEGVAAAHDFGSRSPDADDLNSVAYDLTESGFDLKMAQDYAGRSIALLENRLRDIQLASLTQEQLHDVYSLSMVWDTAAWARFLAGDVAGAVKAEEASWKLSQHGVAADHLAQVYEKLGRKDEAAHLLRLSLATGDRSEGAAERLQKIAPTKPQVQMKGNTATVQVRSGAGSPEELGKLRTVDVPGFSRPTGTAEYFVLLASKGVEDVMFISGADELRGAKDAIAAAKFDTPFGDEGPEKIARRGILSCSQYTKPNCQFVLLLPSNAKVP